MISQALAYAASGLAIALGFGLGIQTVRLHTSQEHVAALTLEASQLRAARSEAAASAVADYRKVENEDARRKTEALDKAAAQLAVAQTGNADLARELDRLRKRSATVPSCGAAASAPAVAGQPEVQGSTGGVPAELPSRIGDLAARYSVIAEEALTKWEGCTSASN